MAKVLTEASDIKCAHSPGAVTAATKKSTAKLTVQGKAVLLSGQESSWQISGCTQTDASSSQTPCMTVTLSGGVASKLTAGGTGVLLDSGTATTSGSPVKTATITANDDKLTAS